MTNLGLFDPPPDDDEPRVFGVRELTGSVGRLLERTYGTVRVRGEVTGYKRAASGHSYFALQESDAQIRCAFFRAANGRSAVRMEDGIEVIAVGRLSIYPARGDFQLIVERVELAGEGARMQALERLKARLKEEGLFDRAAKRPLPPFPLTVGVVTSAHGAALRDIVRVLDSRWPGIDILLTPVPVQGEGAALAIGAAIERHVRAGRADLIIVGRGGGSVDDLWAFNEEPVARAIAACPIPVISAVGHESDILLSDLVADVRAATPSQAAELAVRERADVMFTLADRGLRLARGARAGLDRRRDRLERYVHSHGMNRPRTVLQHALQRVDDLADRLTAQRSELLARRRERTESVGRRLALASGARTSAAEGTLTRAADRLRAAERVGRDTRLRALERAGATLSALDPTGVLARGYSICVDGAGRAVTDGDRIAAGDSVRLRFHRGGAEGTITRSWGGDAPAAPEPNDTTRARTDGRDKEQSRA